jgi:hypothetical protein
MCACACMHMFIYVEICIYKHVFGKSRASCRAFRDIDAYGHG